jgi:ribonuclease R
MLTEAQKDQVIRYVRSLKAQSFTFRDVVRALEIDSDDRRSLQHYLDELDEEGVVHRIRRGRYALPATEKLVSGTLTCHRDGYGFLVPDDRTIYKQDIFIPPRNMEGALHGDRVLAKVSRRQRKTGGIRGRRGKKVETVERTEGIIVRVLERRHPTVVGRYYNHPRFPFVVPLDTRMLHDISIPYHAGKGAKDGQVVVVSMTVPPGRNQEPEGRVEEILGYPGDPGIEYRIVEHKFGLPVEFSPEAKQEAAATPDHVLPEEYESRQDLRDEIAVTIDGETARDFDDAISLKKLPSGHRVLGVHIADVSNYVRADSALDEDAYARGTSVYFPDRAIPMLPPELSSGICSLKPKVDRLVLSAIMEVDPHGNVVSHRFVEGIVRSRERMTYTSVAKILVQRDPDEMRRYAELVPMFELMEELCLTLSRKRERRGSVDFDLPEAQIDFDRDGRVKSVLQAERTIAHRIVEEFMLLANETVAAELEESGGPALYRVHEEPDRAKVDDFADFARALGYRLESRNGDYEPRDFQKFVSQLEGKPEARFITYLMLRSFMQARYSEKNVGHFGLAADRYTHFTSPIRRYPDLVVHRLLKESLKKQPSAGWREQMTARLPDIAAHSSARERNADEAEREIEKIKIVQFMADRIGEEFEAVVLSVTRQGFFVELLEHFVDGFVPIETLVDDYYQYHEKNHMFVGERRKRRFQLGSRVRVRLDHADRDTYRLSFSVLPN